MARALAAKGIAGGTDAEGDDQRGPGRVLTKDRPGPRLFPCLPDPTNRAPGQDHMPSPEKPKLSAEERRIRQADRLTTIRLRMAIGRELDDRDITTPAAIGEALGMPAPEATKLLTGHQWREGDVARLQAVAARLGLQVPAALPTDAAGLAR